MGGYAGLLKNAESLRFKFKDLVDQPNDHHAQSVAREIDALVSDVKGQRNAPGIDNRLKNIEHHLRGLDGEVMDHNHSDMLADWCEEMRHETRSL